MSWAEFNQQLRTATVGDELEVIERQYRVVSMHVGWNLVHHDFIDDKGVHHHVILEDVTDDSINQEY